MDKKQQLIQICRELRLPSIRKMVQDETEFKNTAQAFEVLLQVLVQEKMIDSYVQNKIGFGQLIFHKRNCWRN